MHNKFKYSGFGLKILSDIEFPELMPSDFKKEDITISLGQISAVDIQEKPVTEKTTLSIKESFYLDVPDVARYLTTLGKSIIVEPYFNSAESSIRLFLLSNSMAALLVQRNKILLHSSSIIYKNELILFMGVSGAGKSSIAAELSLRGYTIFSDDVCVLQPILKKDKSVYAIASYPMMKLWDDTINALDDDQFEKTHKLRPMTEKYGHFFHENFEKNAYPIKKIFILNPNLDSVNYSAKKNCGLEAFEWLSKNTYRGKFILENKIQKIHFESICKLIQKTEIYELSRPVDKSDIKSFTDFAVALL